MSADPEPPEVTAAEKEEYDRGMSQLEWQVKWLRILRWPVFAALGISLYIGLLFPEFEHGFLLILGTVLVTFAVMLPFMWTTRLQKRAFRVWDKLITRHFWETRGGSGGR